MDYIDLYETLLFSKEFRGLSGKDVFYAEYSLESQAYAEGRIAEGLLFNLNKDRVDKYICDILISLDNIAYVPFGERGAKAQDALLKENDKDDSYAKRKLDIFVETLKNNKVEVTEELMATLKKFVDNYFSTQLDLNDPVNLAIMVRRISGELEHDVINKLILNPMGKNEVLRELLRKLVAQTSKEDRTIDLEQYLPESSKMGELDKEQIEYLKNITGMSSSKEKMF